jgi:hypothetical protein
VRRVVALEYCPIPALAVLMPAGSKLLLVNPLVRRGVLLLQQENVVALGGAVRAARTAVSVRCRGVLSCMAVQPE